MTKTYKTAADLRITPEEHAGLIYLMGQFRGEHAPEKVRDGEFNGLLGFSVEKLRGIPEVLNTRLGFHMSYGTALPTGQFPVRGRYECGTAACIGGHLSLHMQGFDTTGNSFPMSALMRADNYVNDFGAWAADPTVLDRLFYPNGLTFGAYDKITPEMAAQAIENALIDGTPGWTTVFREHGLERFIDDIDA